MPPGSDSNDFYASLRAEIADGLARSALGFYRTGLDTHDGGTASQVVVANCGIAVELATKSALADLGLGLLLLPRTQTRIDLRIAFAAPEAVSIAVWRKYQGELRASAYRTIGLAACADALEVLLPEETRRLKPHLDLLVRYRDASVHGHLPQVSTAEAHRAVYVAATIVPLLLRRHTGLLSAWGRAEDQEALGRFDIDRTRRIDARVEAAGKKADQLPHLKQYTTRQPDGWNRYFVECPVCKSRGTLHGTTRYAPQGQGDTYEDLFAFDAARFDCSECGLALEDPDEMDAVGLWVVAVRECTTEEVERWMNEQAKEEHRLEEAWVSYQQELGAEYEQYLRDEAESHEP